MNAIDYRLRSSIKCYLGNNKSSEFNAMMVRYHTDKQTLLLTLEKLIAEGVVSYENFKYSLKPCPRRDLEV